MMTRLLSALGLFAATFLVAFYVTAPPAPQSAAVRTTSEAPAKEATEDRRRAEGPALWRAAGGGSPIFLFGSFHLLKPGEDWMRPAIRDAFETADALVVEIDPTAYSATEMSAAVTGRARLPQDTRLADILSPEIHAAVTKQAEKLGFPPDFFEPYQPWFVGMTLTQRVLSQEGYEGQLGVDQHFLRRAKEAGLPIRELETLEDQITALSKSAGEDPNGYMRLFLNQLQQSREFFDELDDMWVTGDVVGLADYMAAERKRDPAAFKALYTRRNRNWLSKLEEFLRDDNVYFVVVGTGHLVGENGIVNLLRERGHKVQRVRR